MSEPKRVPLQTLEFANAAKKDKGKQLLPSHRFTLTLLESNEKTCPEFDYAQLLKAAEVSKIRENCLRLNKNLQFHWLQFLLLPPRRFPWPATRSFFSKESETSPAGGQFRNFSDCEVPKASASCCCRRPPATWISHAARLVLDHRQEQTLRFSPFFPNVLCFLEIFPPGYQGCLSNLIRVPYGEDRVDHTHCHVAVGSKILDNLPGVLYIQFLRMHFIFLKSISVLNLNVHQNPLQGEVSSIPCPFAESREIYYPRKVMGSSLLMKSRSNFTSKVFCLLKPTSHRCHYAFLFHSKDKDPRVETWTATCSRFAHVASMSNVLALVPSFWKSADLFMN